MVTRQQLIDSLQDDWGAYVSRFQRLPSEVQARFLQQQGYARFADLLGHVFAWWEQGKPAVERMLVDPAYDSENCEVDSFNARAVERFKHTGEAEMIALFEEMRLSLLRLVTNLPDEAFQDPRITARLHIEVIGHYQEHRDR